MLYGWSGELIVVYEILFCVGWEDGDEIKNWCVYAIRTIKDEEHDVFCSFCLFEYFLVAFVVLSVFFAVILD